MYLLGAGFSQIVSGGKAPSSIDLYNKIKDKINEKILERYKDLNDDIEKLLTLIELDILTNSKEIDLLKITKKVIHDNIVDLLSIDKLKPSSDKLIKCFINLLKKNDIVVSINYDILLEHYLWLNEKWTPSGGYTDKVLVHPSAENDVGNNTYNIKIIKPHGSVNFAEAEYFDKSGKTFFGVELNDKSFPKININYTIYNKIKEKILLPAYIKAELLHRLILDLWEEAFKNARKDNTLIIIGCSLRKADVFVWLLIYYVLNHAFSKVIIIDEQANTLKNEIEKTMNIPKLDNIIAKEIKIDNNNNFDFIKELI